MEFNYRLAFGSVYVLFAIFTIFLILPVSLFVYSETESSIANVELSLGGVELNWINSTRVGTATVEFSVKNPSSSFGLSIIDLKINFASLNGERLTVFETANVFVEIGKTIDPRSTDGFVYSKLNFYNFYTYNSLMMETKNSGGPWNWFFWIQIRASLGTDTNLNFEGPLEVTGVIHSGNP